MIIVTAFLTLAAFRGPLLQGHRPLHVDRRWQLVCPGVPARCPQGVGAIVGVVASRRKEGTRGLQHAGCAELLVALTWQSASLMH